MSGSDGVPGGRGGNDVLAEVKQTSRCCSYPLKADDLSQSMRATTSYLRGSKILQMGYI